MCSQLSEWKQREGDIAEEEKLGATAAAVKSDALAEDLAAVRSLLKLHTAYSDAEASELSEAANDELNITKSQLLTRTLGLLSTQREELLTAQARMEAAAEAQATAVNDARDDLETEKRLIQTQRQALEIAHKQRMTFRDEKQNQLLVEKAEVLKAREILLGEQHSIAMLQNEMAKIQEISLARDKEAQTQYETRDALSANLDGIKAEAQKVSADINLRLEAERSVERSQKKYVDELVKQLKKEQQRVAAAMQTLQVIDVPESATHGAAGVLGEYLSRGAGHRGAAAVHETNESHKKWLDDLLEQKQKCERDLAIAKSESEAIEKKAAGELDLLRSQQVAIKHALAKQEDYMANLKARKPISQAKVATTPLSRARSARSFSNAHGVSPSSVVSSLPSKEEVSTPYSAAHKYLSEKFTEMGDDLYI